MAHPAPVAEVRAGGIVLHRLGNGAQQGNNGFGRGWFARDDKRALGVAVYGIRICTFAFPLADCVMLLVLVIFP